MKKFKVILLIACVAIVGGIGFAVGANQHTDLSTIISITHASAENSTGNTGPAESEECGKMFCNVKEKWCECENEYSCTERMCSH